MKKIILFVPRESSRIGPRHQIVPLAALALAGPLIKEGYEVKIIDAAIEENFSDQILKECLDAICVGISFIYGYQVHHAAEISKQIRNRFPHIPIIYGGWLPTVRPELFLENNLADVVVSGQGEETFLELLRSLERAQVDLTHIKGIYYKKNGHILATEPRKLIDLNEFPSLPYHVIDVNRYLSWRYDRADWMSLEFLNSLVRSTGRKEINRSLWYYSSWGCPERCNFCCSAQVCKRRWIALKAERMVDDIEHLLSKYNFDLLVIGDANFTVNEKRVNRFCKGLIERSLNLLWYSSAEASTLVKYSDETIDLMSGSGCVSLMIGGETACPETMKLINKNIKPGQVEAAIKRLEKRNISSFVNYIIGFPDETKESIEQTIEEWIYLRSKYPKTYADISGFIPLPGSAFYTKALNLGYQEPKFPEDYEKIDGNVVGTFDDVFVFPGKTTKAHKRKIMQYKRLFSWANREISSGTPKTFFHRVLQHIARQRIKYRFEKWQLEFKMLELVRTIFHRICSILRQQTRQ